MVPTRTLPISGLWKCTLHAATGLLIAAFGAAYATTAAKAGVAGGTQYEVHSRVDTAVSPAGGGLTTYNYTVNNTSIDLGGGASLAAFVVGGGPVVVNGIPFIVDWELPYFADANIVNITSPSGWTYEIETVDVPNATTGWAGDASWQDPSDPFYPGAGSPFLAPDLQVIHWYSIAWAADNSDLTDAIAPGADLPGFSLDSPFGTPVDAPYQASWDILPVVSGDPPFPGSEFFLPGSPTLLQVPEPGALALFGIGLAGLALIRRRRTV